MRLGLDPALYWELTPREGELIVVATVRRLRREHNERMTAAWYAGAMPMMKKPPALKDLMVPEDPAPKRRMTPAQIRAALMFALGKPKDRQHGEVGGDRKPVRQPGVE